MVPTKEADLLTEPLLHNLHLCVQVAESPSVSLVEITRIGDLLDYDRGDWVGPYALSRQWGSPSLVPRCVLREVEAALLSTCQSFLEWVLRESIPHPPLTLGPPDLFIQPLPCESSRPPPLCTSSWLRDLQPVHFRTTPWDHLYTLELHILHFPTLTSYQLQGVGDAGGPVCIPSWFHGPPGTLVGSSSMEP
ncbi:unnamed protein product [Natator depressus]